MIISNIYKNMNNSQKIRYENWLAGNLVKTFSHEFLIFSELLESESVFNSFNVP